MSDVFSTVTADIAVNFVQKFSSDASCLSFLERVCSKVRLEFTKTDENYRIVGDWKAMESTHTLLQAVLDKYDAKTGTFLDDALSFPSLGTDVRAKHLIDEDEKPKVLVRSPRSKDSCQRESVIKRRTGRIQSAECKRESRKERRVSSAKVTRNNTPQNAPDRHSLEVDEEKQNFHGKENSDDDGNEALPPIYSELNEEADIDKENPAVQADTSASTANSNEKTKGTRHAVASKSKQARGRRSNRKSTNRGGKTSEAKTTRKPLKCNTKAKKFSLARDRLSCSDCTFVASSKCSLNSHRRKSHPIIPAVCDVCGKMFMHKRYLRRHQSSHGEARHSCELCGKVYKGQKRLMEHQRRHQEGYSKPALPCPQCPKTFCNQYVLSCHIRDFHEGQRQMFLCSICGKSFTTKHSLQEHMNIHTGKKPYKCEECSKAFSYESALRYHRFTHEKVKQFSCPECHKTFSQKSGLRVHARIHEGIRQFQCLECGRAFTQKQALKRHERTHKGDKPFGCKLCGRTFIDASIVRRHLSLVHKIHKDSKTWREDVDFSPSNFGQGSLAVSVDSKQTREHSTKVQEKALLNSASGANLVSLNHSNWCHDGDFSSSQSNAATNTPQNQRTAPGLPEQSSGPWLTTPPQPHPDPAPLDPNSMLYQPNVIIPLPGSGLPLPGTLQSFHNPLSFPPVTTESGETSAGQQLVVSPSALHSPADQVVKVSDGASTVLMPHEQTTVEEWPAL